MTVQKSTLGGTIFGQVRRVAEFGPLRVDVFWPKRVERIFKTVPISTHTSTRFGPNAVIKMSQNRVVSITDTASEDMRVAPTIQMLGTDLLLYIMTLLRRSSPLAAMQFTATCKELLALCKQNPRPLLKISMLKGQLALAYMETIVRHNRFKTANELALCSGHAIVMDEDLFWPSMPSSTTKNTRFWHRYDGNARIADNICRLLFYSPCDDAAPRFSIKDINGAVFNYHPSTPPETVTLGCAHDLWGVLHAGMRDKCVEVSGKMSFPNEVVSVSFNVDLHFQRRRPSGPRDNNEFQDSIVFSNAKLINLVLNRPVWSLFF